MKSGFDSGRCTWPSCRTVVKNGQGHQVLSKDGTFDRYCDRHYSQWLESKDAEPKAIIFGISLALIILIITSTALGIPRAIERWFLLS